MARVLWISDAGRTTGFSHVTHAIAEPLTERGHDVHVLAIGWDAKDAYTGPLKLYRSEAGPGHNYLGLDRMVELVKKVDPEVIVTLEDPPMSQMRFFNNRFDPEGLASKVPTISYIPVDGYGVPRSWRELTEKVTAVAMSRHGAEQLGIQEVVYHAYDPSVFYPISPERPIVVRGQTLTSKLECRQFFHIPEDAFIVGRVDTNTGRKDWGATWRAMDLVQQLRRHRDPPVAALWHTKAVNYGHGINLNELCSRGKGTYIITNADDWAVEMLVALINAMDAYVTTSRGEGFGLGQLQALACGIPVVASDAGATREIVGDGGFMVDPLGPTTNPYGLDQQLADARGIADALTYLHRNPEDRSNLSRLAILQAEKFSSWLPAIDRFDQLITEKAQRSAG